MKPMNRRVFSGTCGEGGLFHDGTGGMSAEEDAEAASEKCSGSGGGGGGGSGL